MVDNNIKQHLISAIWIYRCCDDFMMASIEKFSQYYRKLIVASQEYFSRLADVPPAFLDNQ